MIRLKRHRWPHDENGYWLNYGRVGWGSYWLLTTDWQWLQRLAGWKNTKRGAVVGGSLTFWKNALFHRRTRG